MSSIPVVIDLTGDDDDAMDCTAPDIQDSAWLQDVVYSSLEDEFPGLPHIDNEYCPAHARILFSTVCQDLVIRPEMTIEIPAGQGKSEYFWIKEIRQYRRQVFLRGHSMKPLSEARGFFADYGNDKELAICTEIVCKDLLDPPLRKCWTTIKLPELCVEHSITITNDSPPSLSERLPLRGALSRAGELFCRSLLLVKLAGGRESEIIARSLREDEVPGRWRVSDWEKRRQWRGEDDVQARRKTYADWFCGGGGTMRGAVEAGWNVVYALDNDKAAMETIAANPDFDGVKRMLGDITDFCASAIRAGFRVDVMHFSPPCPGFCPRNRGGRNDEKNRAAGFVIPHGLDIHRPRVATCEQTSGIVTHYKEWFSALLRQFTDVGYSVRAKVLDLATYGNVQPRKRTIIIATCPGEPLYPFPQPTHGPDLKPWVTVKQRLRTIRGQEFPAHMTTSQRVDRAPFDANKPLQHAIMAQSDEWDCDSTGRRNRTIAELASLQGFPHWHRFVGTRTQMYRQIGNAVPPVFVHKLFSDLDKMMRWTDIHFVRPRS